MRGEDKRIMTREMERKLVETLLLVLAVALGVGVAAAGFSLAATAGVRSARELALPQYREIAISTRSDAEDSDSPAQLNEKDEEISLTYADLDAAREVPSVSGGFILKDENYHLGDPMARFQRQGNQPPDAPEAGENPPAGQEPQQNDTSDPMAEMQAALAEMQEEMANEPEPLMDELRGYEVTADFFEIRSLYASEGSLFTLSDMENQRPLMVVGSEIASTLFEDGIALNRKIQVFDTIYRVSGILEETGTELDSRVFTPMQVSSAMTVRGPGAYRGSSSTLYFSVDDPEDLSPAAEQLNSWFSAEYGEGAVNIDIPRTEASEAADRNGRLITLILFLALSGLLIASVNVSNILMGRAMRREKMVGILKALGASKKRIFLLFFEEALIIGVAGSLLGAGLSLLITRIMTDSMGLEAFSAGGITGGILFALTITLALTLFPAFQASRIEAAQAMRTE
ncbi:MAG: ABC transporter permease [Spirochaetales bacterium]|nr:ABC transporter permease [Spirochaetales bacterium]